MQRSILPSCPGAGQLAHELASIDERSPWPDCLGQGATALASYSVVGCRSTSPSHRCGRCAIESEYRKLGYTPSITLDPQMPTCGVSLNAATTLATRGLRRTASLPHGKSMTVLCCASFATPCWACSKSDGAQLDQADFPLTEVLSWSTTQMRRSADVPDRSLGHRWAASRCASWRAERSKVWCPRGWGRGGRFKCSRARQQLPALQDAQNYRLCRARSRF